MTTNKMLTDLSKKGEVTFVYYWDETKSRSDVVVCSNGSPFKSTIVVVDFQDEDILYTECIVKVDVLVHRM
jgi:hypothetical protein